MCRHEVARPEIDLERQNGVPGYTQTVIRGIWGMAANKI